MINKIYNEDCRETMRRMESHSIGLVLTSPFYNTAKRQGSKTGIVPGDVKNGSYTHCRYDIHVDTMTNDEYCDFTVGLFEEFDRVLQKDGCVLYNLSYASENTECVFRAVNDIICRTKFTIADCISWKKCTALPNNTSPNKLTRIIEFVFVFCRKDDFRTFKTNKQVTSQRANGQKYYENIPNYIEARNNDGSCPYNKATYSSDLCEKLLKIYAPIGTIVYDPFMGTGTTAVACNRLGLEWIGSELSEKQCEWAEKRIANEKEK